MKRWLKSSILATGLAIVAVLLLGASAFAKGPAQRATAPGYTQNYTMGYMGGRNWGGPENSLIAVTAKVLGMNQADLVADLNGKTIADVAKEKGVSTQKIVDAFLAPRAEALKNAVEVGRLTQAQADQVLATMKANVTAQLSQTWTPRGAGAGLGFVDANKDGICDYRQ
jgi:hypothetical protein